MVRGTWCIGTLIYWNIDVWIQ